MNKCRGCGASLQWENSQKIGYIPKEKIENGICERCFRIVHYNDLKTISLNNIKNIIDIVNEKGSVAFFLVDLLNIQKDVIKTYHSLKIPTFLIISKCDIIPKFISFSRISTWLKEEYHIQEEVFFLSALRNKNVKIILRILERIGKKEAYILGYTNSGKSTLFNQLLEMSLVTTSIVPNTTVDFIKHIIGDYTLIDTPGFPYQDVLYRSEDISFLKKANTKSYINPITYQLKKGASLILENVIRIENKSEVCNLTFYVSNQLSIKKVYEKNQNLKDKKEYFYTFSRNEVLVINGVGFITFKTESKVSVFLEN